jgi:triacylglycerol lipase
MDNSDSMIPYKMNSSDALVCAQVSDAVYSGQGPVDEILGPIGFGASTWVDVETPTKDVNLFVASSAVMNLICFRGTKIYQDWMSDLQSTPVRFEWVFSGGPNIGEVHTGFGNRLSDGLDAMRSVLAGLGLDKPLIITGHSLGGALAAMLGACFTVYEPILRPVSAVYTFGQPRIGLHDFCGTYDRILKGKLVRFINNTDVVPQVPFTGWDYADEGKIIHFDESGIAQSEVAQWSSFFSRTFQSLRGFTDILLHMETDVGDHNMTLYRELVANNQPRIDELLAGSPE